MIAQEELEKELLAFKHLAILPDSIESITFKVQLLCLTTEFQKDLFINYSQRSKINHDKYHQNLITLLQQLKLSKPIDSQRWRQAILLSRKHRNEKMFAQINQMKDAMAFDKAEEEKVASKMGKIEQDILQCIALELDAFRRVKEKEGTAFKYSDVTEEELRKVAEKRLERALEAVRFVQEKAKSKTS